MQLKVSIILPVYNVEQWLDETIHSIQEQTLPEWEAIFVIDGSTDRSEEIIARYAEEDKRLKIFKQENRGQGAARDFGVENARGDYLFFLDPDDLIPPNAIQVAYQRAIDANADIVVGDYIPFKDGRQPTLSPHSAGAEFHHAFSKYGQDIFYRTDITDQRFFYHGLYFMVVWMKLFKRATWLQNEIKAPAGLSMGEDFMTVKKMCFLQSKICTVDAVLIYYRKRANSSTTLRSEKAFGIFTSFQYTRSMYQEMLLSSYETSLMYAAYMDWFYSHLIQFTPYSSMYRFYQIIKKTRFEFFDSKIDHSVLGWKRSMAMRATCLPSVLGFAAYLILMWDMKGTVKLVIVKTILFSGKILPAPLHRQVLRYLVWLQLRLDHKPLMQKIMRKVIFHFQKKY